MHINELPTELLTKIFQSVDDVSERIELERVCRRWRNVSRTNLWRGVQQIRTQVDQPKILRAIADRCGSSLAELRMKNLEFDGHLTTLICNSFPKLKHLDFRCCDLGEQAINSILNKFASQLRTLMFFDMDCWQAYQRVNHGTLLMKANELQHLCVDFSYNHSNGQIPDPLPSKLKSLFLNSFSEFENDVIRLLKRAATMCSVLKLLYLDIDTWKIEEILPIIATMGKRLVFLRLPRLYHRPRHQAIPDCLSKLTSLKALRLSNCQFLPRNLVDICPQLNHLRLSFSPSDEISLSSLQKLTSLRSLSLRIPSRVLTNLLNIFYDVKNATLLLPSSLEHLDIQGGSLEPLLVQKLIQHCPNLISLHLPVYSEASEYQQLYSAITSIKFGEDGCANSLTVYFHALNYYAKFVLPRDVDLIARRKLWMPGDGVLQDPVLDRLFADEFGHGVNSPSFLINYWSADKL